MKYVRKATQRVMICHVAPVAPLAAASTPLGALAALSRGNLWKRRGARDHGNATMSRKGGSGTEHNELKQLCRLHRGLGFRVNTLLKT